MEFKTVLYLIMLSVFISYVGFIWIKYGIQKSISDSYYRLPKKLKPLFYFFCLGFAIPAIILGDNLLIVLAGSLICFVGAASAFKGNSTTKWTHMVGAYGGVLLSQIAIWVYYDMWYITVTFIVLSGLMYILNVKDKIWWIELLAFSSICVVLGLNL